MMLNVERFVENRETNELIVEVFRLNGQLIATADKLVSKFGITGARWQVMGALVRSGGRETVPRLAKDMGLTRQSIQRVVNEMVIDGMLLFEDNPHHQRSQLVTLSAKGEKEIGSRSGMTRSATSSPYYAAWVAGQPPDLAAARIAIRGRDFAALAEVAEHNCLKMHAAALAANPPLVYWNGATVECLHAVRRLRARGVPVFFTIDAGPQLKAVCLPGARAEVERSLRGVPGVLELLTSALGPGAELR